MFHVIPHFMVRSYQVNQLCFRCKQVFNLYPYRKKVIYVPVWTSEFWSYKKFWYISINHWHGKKTHFNRFLKCLPLFQWCFKAKNPLFKIQKWYLLFYTFIYTKNVVYGLWKTESYGPRVRNKRANIFSSWKAC